MAVSQPNGNAVWTETKGSAQTPITNMVIIDNGTHYSFSSGAADAKFLDNGNGAYDLDTNVANPGDLPELGIVNVGDAVIMTYE